MSIQIPNQLREDIVQFSNTNNDPRLWRRIDTVQTFQTRGRKIIHTTETPFEDQVNQISEHILDHFDCSRVRRIPHGELSDLVMCLFDSGQNAAGLLTHKDPKSTDKWLHLRFNFMLQKPGSGGDVIVEKNILDVKEGQSWNMWASEKQHRATQVKGDVSRITLSLGFYVDPLYKSHVQNKMIDLVDIVTD
jgi:acyl-CoA-binding protein